MKKSLFRQILMNKRKVFVFLFLLVLLLPTFAYAESFIERALATPINGIVNGIRALGFKTIDELVFDLPNTTTAPFTADEWNIAMTWYKTVEIATAGLAVIAMIISGFRLMSAGSNPSKRADAMQKMWLVVLAYAIIWFLPHYLYLIFAANAHLTELFKNLMQVYAKGGFSQGGWEFIDAIQTNNLITTALVKLAFVGLMIYFNFLYTIRKFVLIAMLVVVPIVVWGWSITGYNKGIGLVAGEIISNAFMQSSHALVLSIYAVLVAPGLATDFSVWWAQLFGLVALIPTSKVLRELFMGFLKFLGVNEEFYAGLAMGGFSGMAAIAGVAGSSLGKIRSTGSRNTSSQKSNRTYGTGDGNSGGTGPSGGSSGGGPYGGQEVDSEPMFGKANYDTYASSPETMPQSYNSTTAYPSTQFSYGNNTGSVNRRTNTVPTSGADKPGEKYQDSLNTSVRVRNIAGGTLGAVGAVTGAAMGLALGGSAMREFGTMGAGIGASIGGAAGGAIATTAGLGYQTLNYGYATSNPNKEYVDKDGNGLIKGVVGEEGEMRYFMPEHTGYENITPSQTFKTEVEAQNSGYKPIQVASLDDRIKNVTGSENAVDGTGMMIGSTVFSPFGTKATKLGGRTGETVFKGARKGYEWIKEVSNNPDKFRWKQ